MREICTSGSVGALGTQSPGDPAGGTLAEFSELINRTKRLANRGAIFEVARENGSWVRMRSGDTGLGDLTPRMSAPRFSLT